MQQLSGLDASFLYLEMPNSAMYIGAFANSEPLAAAGISAVFRTSDANPLRVIGSLI